MKTPLQHAGGDRTATISALGHEMKTPVAGLRMGTHLLLEEKIGPLNADQRELVEVMRDDCERLLVFLKALVEKMSLEAGEIEMQVAPHAPADLAKAAVDALRARKDGLVPVVEVAGELPRVAADFVYVSRAMEGLFARASRPVVLRVAPGEGGRVRFSVISEEPPFSAAEKAKAFEPLFRRAGGETAGITGLEPAICRAIAARHGGCVGVAETAATGQVEFFLELPAPGK